MSLVGYSKLLQDMKKISMNKVGSKDLTSVYTRRRKNSVVLGNDVDVSFSNAKHAKSFLIQVNRELNFKIDELNLLFIELFREYRVIWRALDPGDSGRALDLNFSIDKLLTRAVEKSQTENGNHFVFHYIDKAITDMEAMIYLLERYYRKMNAWHSKRMIASYHVRLKAITEEIKKIGSD